MDYLILQKFLIAIAIGTLFGIEREREKELRINFGGFRTFILVSLLGAVSSYMRFLYDSDIFFGVIFFILGLITCMAYYFVSREGYLGIITELSVFITFLLGFLAITEHTFLAVILSVFIVILIESKNITHSFIKKTSEKEWIDTLRFAAVAFIIYPLLPDAYIDPWQLINPSKIWLTAVLISGIGFIAYFLLKINRSSKTIILNGILGGLVSSTATTSSMALQSKHSKGLTSHLVTATVASILTMFVRVGLIIYLINSELLKSWIISSLPMIIALVLSTIAVITLTKRSKKSNTEDIEFQLASPFDFKPALKLALLIAIIQIVANLGERYVGDAGILALSIVSGLTDVDAISVSIVNLFNDRAITSSLAMNAILLSVISNNTVKAILGVVNGSRLYAIRLGIPMAISVLIGIITILFFR